MTFPVRHVFLSPTASCAVRMQSQNGVVVLECDRCGLSYVTPTVEELVTAGLDSEYIQTRKLAEQVSLLVKDLRKRLIDEGSARETKARLAELKVELIEAQAQFAGALPKRKKSVPRWTMRRCEVCGMSFKNLGVHQANAGHRMPRRVK